ncbi:hypothetical protein J7F03_30515 [Streptomyces sp. ISL-43]|uniref:hypothetical protein n=1 Tax=Streptomyces sp. ISL-43 TaxID=2819183 RepID=UPI001BE98A45|nr:hypothetical protein [Streptomyces sp. ISL-43]MBT2451328.1 hypothetical protein [Streptomyces sp. ISL-43]
MTKGTDKKDKDRARLTEEVHAVINAVLSDATVMDLPSGIAPEVVSVTAFDAADTRSDEVLTDALVGALRTAGWAVDDSPLSTPEPSLYAAKAGLGGGSFAVRPTAVSFDGLPARD